MAKADSTKKRCCRCDTLKARSDFYTDSRNKDGLQGACVACFNAGIKRRKAANPEPYRAKRRANYRKNRETILAQNAASRARHRDKVLAGKREYRKKNKAKVDAGVKAWIKANPEKYSAYRRANEGRRRAAEKGGDSRTEIAAWVLAQPKVCFWCLADCAENFHLDHIKPISKGGRHVIANLAISCPPCNHRKSAKDPARWMREMNKETVMA